MNEWAQDAIHNRLQYVRQMYTCLFEASLQGQTCFDPLFFHYPLDNNTYSRIESTFVFANTLMVLPVTIPDAFFVTGYFPAGRWVDINDLSTIVVECPDDNLDCYGTYGELIDIDVSDIDDSQVDAYIMPGKILAF